MYSILEINLNICPMYPWRMRRHVFNLRQWTESRSKRNGVYTDCKKVAEYQFYKIANLEARCMELRDYCKHLEPKKCQHPNAAVYLIETLHEYNYIRSKMVRGQYTHYPLVPAEQVNGFSFEMTPEEKSKLPALW